MAEFFEYLRNITYYLMFATIVGIFAPVGKYKKFVSLVLGFVLLLLMIQPLAYFFQGRDIPVTQWFAGVPEISRGAEYAHEAWWDSHLRGAFEAQLEAQLARILNANGFALHSAEFEHTDFAEINSISVSVSRENFSANERLIRIQPPQFRPIQIGEQQVVDCPQQSDVKNLISEFYNLPTSHIYVKVV
jgi:hypothetical protein